MPLRFVHTPAHPCAPCTPLHAPACPWQKLAHTYGKAFHLWQVDRGDPVPLGERAHRHWLAGSERRCLLYHISHGALAPT